MAARTRLAGATRRCTGCRACECMGEKDCRELVFPDETGVRVPCIDIHIYFKGKASTLPCCQGRDWVVATGGWEEAAVKAGASVSRTWWNREGELWGAEVRLVATHLSSSYGYGATPDEARLDALTRAVEAMGATLMEVASV